MNDKDKQALRRVTRRHMLEETWKPSETFGGWEYEKNGLQQFGKSAKEFIAWVMEDDGFTREHAKRCLDQVLGRQIWKSTDGRYKVVKEYCYHDDPMPMVHDKMWDGTIWLSVRICKIPGEGFYGDEYLRDWRDFQMIKQDFCGTDNMGIEIYPRKKYCVDTAHVFHMWVLPQHLEIPLGWKSRDVEMVDANQRDQRPFDGWSI